MILHYLLALDGLYRSCNQGISVDTHLRRRVLHRPFSRSKPGLHLAQTCVENNENRNYNRHSAEEKDRDDDY
jgi:hypothetical protein